MVVYDGDDYDAALLAIDAATRVTVEDETVNLRDLVFEVTQFITKAELHEESVLFQDPQNVGDIRAWAANGGVFFGPGGARLERNMKTLILEVAKAALDAQRDLKKRGAGQEARVEQRAADRAAKANAGAAKREVTVIMKDYDDEYVATGAAACDPPRMALGMLNLLKTQSKEVLALEC